MADSRFRVIVFARPPRRSWLALVLAWVVSAATLDAAPLRVLAFNVQNGLYPNSTASYQDTARILRRLNADVLGLCELMNYDPWLQTWVNDETNFPELAADLALPHLVFDTNATTHRAGIASRYPIAGTVWVSGPGMTRRIPLVRIEVPEASERVWVAMLHLRAGHTDGSEQHIRAVELSRLRQAILTHCDPQNDIIVIMGDFNLVSPTDEVFHDRRYGGITYPLYAWKEANAYFVPEQIFKLDARHAGRGNETYTWRGNNEFPPTALDHIMVNSRARARGVRAEVYDVQKDAAGIDGLPKYGPRPPPGASYTSDHLPVFADVPMTQDHAPTAQLAVDDLAGLAAEGPAVGPYTPPSGRYVLLNEGAAPLQWVAQSDAAWVSLSSYAGTIPAGGGTVVQASLAPATASLPAGRHQAALRFINRTNQRGGGTSAASLFVGPFTMDGQPDAPDYTVSGEGLTLRVAVRGTRLYVATLAPPNLPDADDHHILIADTLAAETTTPAPWAKRGRIAAPAQHPYLAAEGTSKWAGWFNAPATARLRRSPSDAGVLEGSLDLVETFGAVPEFLHLAAVAYETADASPDDAARGRVVAQTPAAVTQDDDITPDEFLRIPVRAITDSAADGRYDILVPGRGFSAAVHREQSPVLRWPSAPGRSYRIWRAPALEPDAWRSIGTLATGAHQWETLFTDHDSVRAREMFYKIELLDRQDPAESPDP